MLTTQANSLGVSGDPAKDVAVGDLSLEPSPGTGAATNIYIQPFQVLDDTLSPLFIIRKRARPHNRSVVKLTGTEPTQARYKTQRNFT